MEKQIDGIGTEPATWSFCRVFPLKEIASGKRACRSGWRNRGEGNDMIAIVAIHDDSFLGSLGIQRETAEDLDPPESYSDIEDMLAEDWFLEDEQTGGEAKSPSH